MSNADPTSLAQPADLLEHEVVEVHRLVPDSIRTRLGTRQEEQVVHQLLQLDGGGELLPRQGLRFDTVRMCEGHLGALVCSRVSGARSSCEASATNRR